MQPLSFGENVFEKPGVKKALGRYVEVVKHRREAKYLALEKNRLENIEESTQKLWRLHDQALKKKSEKGEHSLLELKAKIAERLLTNCVFCEWRCGANRGRGEKGKCGVVEPRVSTMFTHWGEEPELIPSGTIFFSGCNFSCVYCQNYEISQNPQEGREVDEKTVADWIRKAEAININYVGGEPTPNLHVILKALALSKRNIPMIWNSNMYMSVETMKLLDGTIDIYLADFRYGNNECAEKYSGAKKYWETVTRNLLLAKKQSEILVRILVLPGHVECCVKKILTWIKKNLGDSARVNLMSQYTPHYKSFDHPEIDRRLSKTEYARAVELAQETGINNIELQAFGF